MRGFRQLSLTTAALVAGLNGPALAEQRIGFSDRLGVDVVARGSPWCKATVDLEFRLRNGSALRTDPQSVKDFIPKLKGPLEGECSTVTALNVQVIGSDGGVAPDHPQWVARKDSGWTAVAVAAEVPQPQAALASKAGSATGSAIELETPATAPALPQPVPKIDVFERAVTISAEELVLMAFRHNPDLADPVKTPDIGATLATFYACKALRQAGSNEFDRQALFKKMEEKAREDVVKSAKVDQQIYKIEFEASFEPYNFDRKGFSFNPFAKAIGRWSINQNNSNCGYLDQVWPTSFYFDFPLARHIDMLPMSEDDAQSFTERRKNQYGQVDRTVKVVIAFRYTAMALDPNAWGRGTAVVEGVPVSIRVYDSRTRRTILEIDEGEIERQLAEAQAAAAEAARKRQEAEAAAKAEAAAVRRQQMAEGMRTRLSGIKDRIARFQAVHEHRGVTQHPSIAAAESLISGKPVPTPLIFQADEDGTRDITIRWPQPLTVSLSTDGSLEKGRWYYGLVDIMQDEGRAKEAKGLLPAKGEVIVLFPCNDEGCAEADNLEEMVRTWVDGNTKQ